MYGDLALRDLETGRNRESGYVVQDGRVDPDGRLLVAGNWEGTLQIWDAKTGRSLG